MRRAMPVVRAVVPVVVLAVIWQLADGPEVLRLLARVEPVWIVAALLSAHLQIILSALRWRLTAAALGQSMSPRRATAEYYLSQLLNLTLPLGVLGDAGRAFRMRHQNGVIRAGQAVMIERMSGQIAMFVVMMAGFAALALVGADLAMPLWVRQIVLGMAVAAALIAIFLNLARYLPGPVAQPVQAFLQAARQALLARDLWPRQTLLSLLIAVCNLATVDFCARATGTDLGLIAVMTLVPVMILSMLVPITIAGWGLREGAAAALWPVAGATAAAGVAASIAFGLVILAASLPGVVMLWSSSDRRSR